MKVGVIGVGRMGSRMARRFLAAGHEVAVCDRDRTAMAAVQGARALTSPADVARSVEAVVTSLPSPPDIDAVITGSDGVLAGARAGLLLIETSTNDHALVCSLAERCEADGVAFLDAPVSGGIGGAETGELTAMVGAGEAAFERALPLLRCVAARIHRMGAVGSGTIAKLANQSIYLSYVALFCETMRLARGARLEVPELLEVLRHSLAGEPLRMGWDRQLLSGAETPVFPIREVLRDLGLAERVWKSENADTPIFDACLEVYRQAARRGLAESDMTTLFGAAVGSVDRDGPSRKKPE